MTTLVCNFSDVLGTPVPNGIARVTSGEVRPGLLADSVIVPQVREQPLVDGSAVFPRVEPGDIVIHLIWKDQHTSIRTLVPDQETVSLSDCLQYDHTIPSDVETARAMAISAREAQDKAKQYAAAADASKASAAGSAESAANSERAAEGHKEAAELSAQAAQDAQANGIAWVKGTFTAALGSLDNAPEGKGQITSGSAATALGSPLPGNATVETFWMGTAYKIQRVSGRLGARHVTYERHLLNGVWSQWEQTHPAWFRGPVSKIVPLPTDHMSLLEGVYSVDTVAMANTLKLPVARIGTLEILPTDYAATKPKTAIFTTNDQGNIPLEIWHRSSASDGVAQQWIKTWPVEVKTLTRDNALAHTMLRDQLRSRIGGPINVGTATPVALVWDDYAQDFRNKVWPVVQSLGIPITLALPSRSINPTPELEWLGGGDVTWAQINAMIDSGLLRLANHGATHGNAGTDAAREDEIVNGLMELRANSPGAPIDCWVQPAANYGTGFNNGDSVDAYATNYAGQLIAGHHPVYTGVISQGEGASVRMTGTPVNGMTRAWLPTRTDVARKSLVTNLYGTDRGIILSDHANTLDTEGRWTTAEMTSFFTWLKEEQDAGRVRLLHLHEWAHAVNNN